MTYDIASSFGFDRVTFALYQSRLNDILKSFTKEYDKPFYTKRNEYNCEELWCNSSVICTLNMNEYFTEYILTTELNKFCEKNLKDKQ